MLGEIPDAQVATCSVTTRDTPGICRWQIQVFGSGCAVATRSWDMASDSGLVEVAAPQVIKEHIFMTE